MTQWYSKDLGDRVAAFAPSQQIQQAFLSLFAAAGQPTDMAIFARFDKSKNEETYFFPPKAEALAKMFDAKHVKSLQLLNSPLKSGTPGVGKRYSPAKRRRARNNAIH